MKLFKKIILLYLSIMMLGFMPEIEANPAVPADAKKLIGKWLRSDADYVIEVKKIDKNGKLEAAYYNPRSINVLRAEFAQKEGALKVVVELSDVGYPGSTYTLTYDQKNDILVGYYYHAGTNDTFDVMFSRKK